MAVDDDVAAALVDVLGSGLGYGTVADAVGVGIADGATNVVGDAAARDGEVDGVLAVDGSIAATDGAIDGSVALGVLPAEGYADIDGVTVGIGVAPEEPLGMLLNDFEGVRVGVFDDAGENVLDGVAGEGDTVRVAVCDTVAAIVRDGVRDGVWVGGGDGDGDDEALQPGGGAAAAASVQLLSGTPTATTPDAVAMVEQPRRSTGSTRVAATTAPAASATNRTPSDEMVMAVAPPRPVAFAAAPGMSGAAVPLPMTNSMLSSSEMRMTV